MSPEKQECIEIYKVLCQSINNHENKRLKTNFMYTSLIVALTALMGSGYVNLFVLSLISLVLSISWYIHISVYTKLSKAKFKVIEALECKLFYKVCTDEWKFFKEICPNIEQTTIEKILSIVTALVSLTVMFYQILLYVCLNISGLQG